MSLNKVMLIGNVGRDPEVRYIDSASTQGQNPNSKVASFTLATTERFRDKMGNLQENTEWHNIVAFRNSADLAEKFIRKGTQLYVEGRLRTRTWNDQTGNKRYTTEIVVENIQLLGRKSDNPAGQEGGYSPAPQQAAPVAQPQMQNAYTQQASAPEDDLPF